MDNSVYIVHVTTKQIQDMNDFYILYMYNGTCSSLFYLLQNSRFQKKEIQKRFLSSKSTVYQYTLLATVWSTSSGMQRWEGAKVLESMPVLHYIPSIARQPAFDLRMGEAKYQ